MAVDAKLTVHTEVEGAEEAKKEIVEIAKASKEASATASVPPPASPASVASQQAGAANIALHRHGAMSVAGAGEKARLTLANAKARAVEAEKRSAEWIKIKLGLIARAAQARMRTNKILEERRRIQLEINKAVEQENERAGDIKADVANSAAEGMRNLADAAGDAAGPLHKVMDLFGKFKVANVYAAAVAAVGYWFKMLRERNVRDTLQMANDAVSAHVMGVENMNRRIEANTDAIERNRAARDAQIRNIRAASDAAKDLEIAQRGAAKAREMVGADTEMKRHAVDRKYERKAIEMDRDNALVDNNRKMDDAERGKRRAQADVNRMVGENAERAQKLNGLVLLQGTMRDRRLSVTDDPVSRKAVIQRIGQLTGTRLTEEQSKDLERTLQDSIDALRRDKTETERKIASTRDLVKDFERQKTAIATERKTIEEEAKARQAGIDRMDREMQMRVDAAQRDREWTLQDRREDEAEADRQSEESRKDMRRNYAQRLAAAEKREKDLDQWLGAREKELYAFNEGLEKKYGFRPTDAEMTEDELRRRERLERRAVDARNGVRAQRDAIARMKYEGDQREVDFRGKFVQSNRLTQMGLGGDATGYARDTAANTKQLVAGVNRIISEGLHARSAGRTVVGFSAGGR